MKASGPVISDLSDALHAHTKSLILYRRSTSEKLRALSQPDSARTGQKDSNQRHLDTAILHAWNREHFQPGASKFRTKQTTGLMTARGKMGDYTEGYKRQGDSVNPWALASRPALCRPRPSGRGRAQQLGP